MALVERTTTGRRVCFGNLWKSKSYDRRALSNAEKVSSDNSNFYAATECSHTPHQDVADNEAGLFSQTDRRRCQRCRRDGCMSPPSDNDGIDGLGSRRASSLFRCFGSRTSRNGSASRRPQTTTSTVDHSRGEFGAGENEDRFHRRGSFQSARSAAPPDGKVSISRQSSKASLPCRENTSMLGDDDFYSLDGDSEDGSPAASEGAATVDPSVCACGYACHRTKYSSVMPIMTNPEFTPGSYEECLAVARSCAGHWVTLTERSESLDSQYRLIGLGMVKRAVMNRLAVPLSMFLEDEDTVLHCWIHTPLGLRHMRSNLMGKESEDDDPDAGKWLGISKVIDYSIPWYCNGKPVRALQQVRHSAKIGTSIETRCILPDAAEGKVMLFNFVMIAKGKTEADKFSADRILRFVSDQLPV